MKFRFFETDEGYYVLKYKRHWYNMWSYVCDTSVMHFPLVFDTKEAYVEFYNKNLTKYK